MLSICKYFLLNEQRMDLDTIRHARKRFLMAKGIGDGTPVAGPSAINKTISTVAGPTSEPAASPTVIKKTLSTVAGPTEISADDWAGKFGGAAKKAVQTAIENK